MDDVFENDVPVIDDLETDESPEVSEGAPEILPEDTDELQQTEDELQDTVVYTSTEVIDYSDQLETIHNDLVGLTNVCNCILFVALITYLLPAVRSLVHKFMFKEDRS